MPANKAHTSARNPSRACPVPHKELTGHLRIISTSATPDPVGAGHACEQGSHFGAESFTGMARSHEELTVHRKIQRVTATAPPLHTAQDQVSACAQISSPSATDRTPVPAPARYGNARS